MQITIGVIIMTYVEAISKRIMELCQKRGLTINGISSLSGLRQSTVNGIVKCITKNPTLKTLNKIATGFHMTVSEFLDFPEMNETFFEDEQD